MRHRISVKVRLGQTQIIIQMQRLATPIRRVVAASQNLSPVEADLQRLRQLRSEIYGIPEETLEPHSHSVFPVLTKEYRSDFLQSHWSVKEVWEWPKAEGMEWTDLKKESIKARLLHLHKRGKGPLAKMGMCNHNSNNF